MTRSAMPAIVYVDGRRVDATEAVVAITEPGYLVGDGVFATLRARRGRCFRSPAHLAQLARGVALFGLEAPPLASLEALLDEAATATGAPDAYVRVTVARASADRARVSVVARALDVPSADDKRTGVRACVVATRRAPASCMDPEVKTTSYAGSLLASREAARRGFAQALQRAVDGSLACAAMANVFVVTGRAVITPPLASGCRAGITRTVVRELAAEAGLDVVEDAVDDVLLARADEVFVTSTRVGCLALRSIDGIRDGLGVETTRALDAALEARIDAETAR